MATTAELLEVLETRLLAPATRRDQVAVAALLADGFVEFGSSGRIFDKPTVIASLPNEPAADREMTNFAVRSLGADAALVTYRVSRRGPSGGAATNTLRSSIWVRIDGRWQMIFHQGTKLPG